MKKTILTLCLLLSLAVLPQVVLAQSSGNWYNVGTENIHLGTSDLQAAVINAINWVLGFLVLVAVIIILIGGFKWMTASGNDEKVASARQTIISGVIGLIIVLAAYAIASFVINQFSDITGIEQATT
jgi:TRAP-type C4-dicarboxylate transport system permease small subunit